MGPIRQTILKMVCKMNGFLACDVLFFFNWNQEPLCCLYFIKHNGMSSTKKKYYWNESSWSAQLIENSVSVEDEMPFT
jgi:hypothetical protein